MEENENKLDKWTIINFKAAKGYKMTKQEKQLYRMATGHDIPFFWRRKPYAKTK